MQAALEWHQLDQGGVMAYLLDNSSQILTSDIGENLTADLLTGSPTGGGGWFMGLSRISSIAICFLAKWWIG